MYEPLLKESPYYSKTNGDWYRIYHQECPNCKRIIVGIYEFKIAQFEDNILERAKKIRFLKDSNN
jgi:hypothetical protein